MGAAAVIGGIGAVASIGSGIIQSNAAQSAANTQAQAENNATANTKSMFAQEQANLQPYMNSGAGALAELNQLTGVTGATTTDAQGNKVTAPGNPLTASLTANFNPTMSQLSQTPGYQFQLQQGLLATQNSAAAQGLGSSGSAINAADQYAQGLAGTTYQSQFQNYLAQNQQTYNMLYNQVSSGQNAAAGVSNLGVQAAASQNQSNTSAAAASAAGTVGSANALTSGLTGTVNNGTQAYLINQLLNQQQPSNTALPAGGMQSLLGNNALSSASTNGGEYGYTIPGLS